MFAEGSAFQVSFITVAPSSDTVVWSMQDQLGNVKGSGSFPVPGGTETSTLSCKAAVSGYFAITATLSSAGGTLPEAGTRPAGIATFGILPNLSATIPAVTYAHQEQHRFGMQGFNDNGPMLTDLGISQTIDNRQLSFMEPNRPEYMDACALGPRPVLYERQDHAADSSGRDSRMGQSNRWVRGRHQRADQ